MNCPADVLRGSEIDPQTQALQPGFADHRATNDLTGFYDLSRAARPFQSISAPKSASFFLNDKRKATDPDDDGDDR